MNRTTALRLAVIGLTAAALGGCLPIMFDRDGNWRGQQPIGPAFGSALPGGQAGVPPIVESPVEEPAAEAPAADEAEESAE